MIPTRRRTPIRRFVRPQTKRTERKRTIAALDALWRGLIYLRDLDGLLCPKCVKPVGVRQTVLI